MKSDWQNKPKSAFCELLKFHEFADATLSTCFILLVPNDLPTWEKYVILSPLSGKKNKCTGIGFTFCHHQAGASISPSKQTEKSTKSIGHAMPWTKTITCNVRKKLMQQQHPYSCINIQCKETIDANNWCNNEHQHQSYMKQMPESHIKFSWM